MASKKIFYFHLGVVQKKYYYSYFSILHPMSQTTLVFPNKYNPTQIAIQVVVKEM